MLKSILAWGIIFCFALTGFWYFILKEYDYSIQFQTPAPPGKVYQKLLGWKYEQLKVETNEKKIPFKKIVQNLKITNSDVSLIWKFLPLNDSLTQVSISVKNQEQGAVFANRWNLLFNKTKAQSKLEKNIRRFKKALVADLNFYNIKIIGKAMAPGSICACISLSGKINKKAHNMIENIGFLSNYILENNLEMAGKPRIKMTHWNLASNNINFNFCFPLKERKHYPEDERIFIKKSPSQKSIKAIFNGNYRDSHQAWFKLLNYANIHGYDVKKKPLEIFHNNPEIGGNSLKWKTEVFLPIRGIEFHPDYPLEVKNPTGPEVGAGRVGLFLLD